MNYAISTEYSNFVRIVCIELCEYQVVLYVYTAVVTSQPPSVFVLTTLCDFPTGLMLIIARL